MGTLLVFGLIVGLLVAFLSGANGKKRGKSGTQGREAHPFKVVASPQAQADDGAFEAWKGNSEQPEASRSRYRDKFQLLNGAEIALYKKLTEAVPALLVFSQVSMSQVFHIKGSTSSGYKQLGEVGRKSIDFLLCRKDDTSIVLAIELNGRYHEREKQKASDEKKRLALEEAGIPLIVLKPNAIPDVAGLRKLIAPHMVDRKRYETERDARLQK